jgi:sec-independent protein translocase protein TatC
MAKRKKKYSTIGDHLEEFRFRLIICIVAFIVASILVYLKVDYLLEILVRPAGRAIFLRPTELFFSRLKLAVFGGIFLSLPITLFEIWRFVSGGLTKRERKYVLFYGPISLVVFAAGAGFAYYVVMPLGLKFLLSFATAEIKPMLSISGYISFVGMLLLSFGTIFELPLVVLFLTSLGMVSSSFLGRSRKYVVVLIFIVAAILTPPDVFTQILMAGPLLFLFEISILLSRFLEMSRRRRAA